MLLLNTHLRSDQRPVRSVPGASAAPVDATVTQIPGASIVAPDLARHIRPIGYLATTSPFSSPRTASANVPGNLARFRDGTRYGTRGSPARWAICPTNPTASPWRPTGRQLASRADTALALIRDGVGRPVRRVRARCTQPQYGANTNDRRHRPATQTPESDRAVCKLAN